jgi:hypothetical protein
MRVSIPSCALLALTGSLAIGGSWVTAAGQGSESQTSSSSQSATTNQFRLVRAGLSMHVGGTIAGTIASVKTYKAEDGEIVQLIMPHFRSADDARKGLQDLKNLATKVTKEEQSTDESGIVSIRSVLSLPGKDQKIATAIVLITGSDFREIESYSAQDAFAFENFAKSPPPMNK